MFKSAIYAAWCAKHDDVKCRDAAQSAPVPKQVTSSAVVRGFVQPAWRLLAAASLALGSAPLALANGPGENATWQFSTTQERVNKAAVADFVEKKRAGYYDSFKTVNNYNTYIERQVNCSVSALTTGNTGSNGLTAATSSPTLSNSGSTSSETGANTNSNGLSQAGLTGVLQAGIGGNTPTGTISSGQSNTGALNSGVSASNTSATTGAVAANGGMTDQVLNSQQSNSGMLTASISASTACAGSLN